MAVPIVVPDLSIDILSHVITDAVDLCPSVNAVGLVGSFARGEQKHSSDVDLIVKYNDEANFSEILDSFGVYVEHVLDYQFNKRLDIIRYDYAVNCASRWPTNDEPWFCKQTFGQMLKEVMWLYER